jgi:6-bladed beta-propeller
MCERRPLTRLPSLLALLAGVHLSCADAQQRQTADPAVQVQSLFAADPADSALADQIGNVRHARLTSTGRAIVVLDEYEPFIKVLDRRGHLIRSFGRAGGGPGELEHPRWLAVQGDSVLAVVDRTRISEFTLDGAFLASRRLPLSPLGITDGCAGGWMVFGTTHVHGRGPAGWNPWLLAIPSIAAAGDSTAQDRVLYRDSVAPVSSGWPGTNVASGGGRFTFLREDPLPRTLFEGTCATGAVREVELGLAFAGPDQSQMQSASSGGKVVEVTLDPGLRPAGIGLLSGGILVARRRAGLRGPTVLNLIGRSDSLVVQVEESYVNLQDARPGVGALFSTAAPWPRVVFVPESTLLAAF